MNNDDEPNPPALHPTPLVEQLLNMGNRNMAALVREDEEDLLRRGTRPIDLRTVPPEKWTAYIGLDVTLPDAVSRYLDGRTEPLNGAEADMLADQVAAFHSIIAPWYVVVSPTLRMSGRAWRFVPELAPLVTGFYLEHEDINL